MAWSSVFGAPGEVFLNGENPYKSPDIFTAAGIE